MRNAQEPARDRFEWDDAKAAKNRRKHRISFEEAQEVFPVAVVFDDLGHSESEPRFIAIGLSAKNRWLTVVFTRPEARVYRIVSARKATGRERERYGQAKREVSGA